MRCEDPKVRHNKGVLFGGLITENLAGKAAIITGGASGIGLAAARECARQGARVALVDVDENALANALQSLREIGEAIAIVADVSDAAQVREYVRQALEQWERIDIFFNNAGIEGRVAPLVEFPEDVFDKVMAINVRGAFLGLKYVLPQMLEQRSGSVINTSSNAGLGGATNFAAYCASKHAVIGLTRTAALEVAPHGVRVNAICPGPIQTRMISAIEKMNAPGDPQAAHEAIIARNPSRRYGTVEEVAQVVAFLASDAASYVNGAVWPIDGGRTAS